MLGNGLCGKNPACTSSGECEAPCSYYEKQQETKFSLGKQVSNMREISEDELNKNIDKYFKIAESENIIVSLENNKKIIMMSEQKYNNLKVGD